MNWSKRLFAASALIALTSAWAESLAADTAEAAYVAEPTFSQPVYGETQYLFGNGNDGINIAAPLGTPVRASADGVVKIVTDELKSYGNLIVIAHSGSYQTVYAHVDHAVVSIGQSVKQGDVIATVGQSGNAKIPMLHFEIRRQAIPQNPSLYLPCRCIWKRIDFAALQ
jgi:murein DD-endopeptidase MepM/ murein hydrolase activator NlpD